MMTARAGRTATAARLAAVRAENARVVATGICPDCGSRLRRNLALTGWWTCEQRGAVGFRARSADKACDWQCFT